MTGYWRMVYRIFGWEYPIQKPSDKSLKIRREMLVQIRKSKLKLNVTRKTTPIIQITPTRYKKTVPIKIPTERKKSPKSLIKIVGPLRPRTPTTPVMVKKPFTFPTISNNIKNNPPKRKPPNIPFKKKRKYRRN